MKNFTKNRVVFNSVFLFGILKKLIFWHLNFTPFVRQYDLPKSSGAISMSKRKPHRHYPPKFKKMVIETMPKKNLIYCETARRFEVSCNTRIKSWGRIYLTEGPEVLAVQKRRKRREGESKHLLKEVENDLFDEIQRLRTKKCLPEKFAGLGFQRETTPAQKSFVVQKPRHDFSLSLFCPDNAVVTVTDCIGLGVVLDEELIEKYRMD